MVSNHELLSQYCLNKIVLVQCIDGVVVEGRCDKYDNTYIRIHGGKPRSIPVHKPGEAPVHHITYMLSKDEYHYINETNIISISPKEYVGLVLEYGTKGTITNPDTGEVVLVSNFG